MADTIVQPDYIASPEPQEIIMPRKKALTDMLQLAEYGDIEALRKYLAALAEKDAQYAPFAVDLGRLVTDFMISEIRQYLRDCLNVRDGTE